MIFCSWVIVLSPFPVPEGGSRSQFGVRTAPALGTLSKTNNDCQIKFKLSQFCRLDASPAVSLDPIARPLRNQGRRNNDTVVPTRGQLELDPVTARSRFIAEAQLRAFMVELLIGAL